MRRSSTPRSPSTAAPWPLRWTSRRESAAVSGWLEAEDAGAAEVLGRFAGAGVTRFVVTSVDRDGMLNGPDLDLAATADSALSA